MDEDGKLQPGDVKGTPLEPPDKGVRRHDSRGHPTGDGNNNEDDEAEEEDEEEKVEEENEEEGDTPDGEPPSQRPVETVSCPTEGVKRRPIQSRKMQEYQAMRRWTNPAVKEWQCPVQSCGRVLHTGPGVRYHKKVHLRTSSESFICDICFKSFKSHNGLKYHLSRKPCRGAHQAAVGTRSSFTSPSTSGTNRTGSASVHPPMSPPPAEHQAQRLMELATIATGPQSPLLQNQGPNTRGSSFVFDENETSAVMTLSHMAQQRWGDSGYTGSQLHALHDPPDGGQQQQQEQPVKLKSKRPMNAFMLFAQRHRADFNRQYAATNNREISTKLSEAYRNLSEDERQRWKDEATRRAEQQKKTYPDCWKRKK